MIAATFKISGPARSFYQDRDSDRFRGRLVTTKSREALARHPSPSAGPVFCRLEDGTPCWVPPAHLSNPDS